MNHRNEILYLSKPTERLLCHFGQIFGIIFKNVLSNYDLQKNDFLLTLQTDNPISNWTMKSQLQEHLSVLEPVDFYGSQFRQYY